MMSSKNVLQQNSLKFAATSAAGWLLAGHGVVATVPYHTAPSLHTEKCDFDAVFSWTVTVEAPPRASGDMDIFTQLQNEPARADGEGTLFPKFSEDTLDDFGLYSIGEANFQNLEQEWQTSYEALSLELEEERNTSTAATTELEEQKVINNDLKKQIKNQPTRFTQRSTSPSPKTSEPQKTKNNTRDSSPPSAPSAESPSQPQVQGPTQDPADPSPDNTSLDEYNLDTLFSPDPASNGATNPNPSTQDEDVMETPEGAMVLSQDQQIVFLESLIHHLNQCINQFRVYHLMDTVAQMEDPSAEVDTEGLESISTDDLLAIVDGEEAVEVDLNPEGSVSDSVSAAEENNSEIVDDTDVITEHEEDFAEMIDADADTENEAKDVEQVITEQINEAETEAEDTEAMNVPNDPMEACPEVSTVAAASAKAKAKKMDNADWDSRSSSRAGRSSSRASPRPKIKRKYPRKNSSRNAGRNAKAIKTDPLAGSKNPFFPHAGLKDLLSEDEPKKKKVKTLHPFRFPTKVQTVQAERLQKVVDEFKSSSSQQIPALTNSPDAAASTNAKQPKRPGVFVHYPNTIEQPKDSQNASAPESNSREPLNDTVISVIETPSQPLVPNVVKNTLMVLPLVGFMSAAPTLATGGFWAVIFYAFGTFLSWIFWQLPLVPFEDGDKTFVFDQAEETETITNSKLVRFEDPPPTEIQNFTNFDLLFQRFGVLRTSVPVGLQILRTIFQVLKEELEDRAPHKERNLEAHLQEEFLRTFQSRSEPKQEQEQADDVPELQDDGSTLHGEASSNSNIGEATSSQSGEAQPATNHSKRDRTDSDGSNDTNASEDLKSETPLFFAEQGGNGDGDGGARPHVGADPEVRDAAAGTPDGEIEPLADDDFNVLGEFFPGEAVNGWIPAHQIRDRLGRTANELDFSFSDEVDDILPRKSEQKAKTVDDDVDTDLGEFFAGEAVNGWIPGDQIRDRLGRTSNELDFSFSDEVDDILLRKSEQKAKTVDDDVETELHESIFPHGAQDRHDDGDAVSDIGDNLHRKSKSPREIGPDRDAFHCPNGSAKSGGDNGCVFSDAQIADRDELYSDEDDTLFKRPRGDQNSSGNNDSRAKDDDVLQTGPKAKQSQDVTKQTDHIDFSNRSEDANFHDMLELFSDSDDDIPKRPRVAQNRKQSMADKYPYPIHFSSESSDAGEEPPSPAGPNELGSPVQLSRALPPVEHKPSAARVVTNPVATNPDGTTAFVQVESTTSTSDIDVDVDVMGGKDATHPNQQFDMKFDMWCTWQRNILDETTGATIPKLRKCQVKYSGGPTNSGLVQVEGSHVLGSSQMNKFAQHLSKQVADSEDTDLTKALLDLDLSGIGSQNGFQFPAGRTRLSSPFSVNAPSSLMFANMVNGRKDSGVDISFWIVALLLCLHLVLLLATVVYLILRRRLNAQRQPLSNASHISLKSKGGRAKVNFYKTSKGFTVLASAWLVLLIGSGVANAFMSTNENYTLYTTLAFFMLLECGLAAIFLRSSRVGLNGRRVLNASLVAAEGLEDAKFVLLDLDDGANNVVPGQDAATSGPYFDAAQRAALASATSISCRNNRGRMEGDDVVAEEGKKRVVTIQEGDDATPSISRDRDAEAATPGPASMAFECLPDNLEDNSTPATSPKPPREGEPADVTEPANGNPEQEPLAEAADGTGNGNAHAGAGALALPAGSMTKTTSHVSFHAPVTPHQADTCTPMSEFTPFSVGSAMSFNIRNEDSVPGIATMRTMPSLPKLSTVSSLLNLPAGLKRRSTVAMSCSSRVWGRKSFVSSIHSRSGDAGEDDSDCSQNLQYASTGHLYLPLTSGVDTNNDNSQEWYFTFDGVRFFWSREHRSFHAAYFHKDAICNSFRRWRADDQERPRRGDRDTERAPAGGLRKQDVAVRKLLAGTHDHNLGVKESWLRDFDWCLREIFLRSPLPLLFLSLALIVPNWCGFTQDSWMSVMALVHLSVCILYVFLVIRPVFTVMKLLLGVRRKKHFSDKTFMAQVFRNGHWKFLRPTELVPGDIFCVEEKAELPCDAVLLSGGLVVDESSLFGTTSANGSHREINKLPLWNLQFEPKMQARVRRDSANMNHNLASSLSAHGRNSIELPSSSDVSMHNYLYMGTKVVRLVNDRFSRSNGSNSSLTATAVVLDVNTRTRRSQQAEAMTKMSMDLAVRDDVVLLTSLMHVFYAFAGAALLQSLTYIIGAVLSSAVYVLPSIDMILAVFLQDTYMLSVWMTIFAFAAVVSREFFAWRVSRGGIKVVRTGSMPAAGSVDAVVITQPELLVEPKLRLDMIMTIWDEKLKLDPHLTFDYIDKRTDAVDVNDRVHVARRLAELSESFGRLRLLKAAVGCSHNYSKQDGFSGGTAHLSQAVDKALYEKAGWQILSPDDRDLKIGCSRNPVFLTPVASISERPIEVIRFLRSDSKYATSGCIIRHVEGHLVERYAIIKGPVQTMLEIADPLSIPGNLRDQVLKLAASKIMVYAFGCRKFECSSNELRTMPREAIEEDISLLGCFCFGFVGSKQDLLVSDSLDMLNKAAMRSCLVSSSKDLYGSLALACRSGFVIPPRNDSARWIVAEPLGVSPPASTCSDISSRISECTIESFPLLTPRPEEEEDAEVNKIAQPTATSLHPDLISSLHPDLVTNLEAAASAAVGLTQPRTRSRTSSWETVADIESLAGNCGGPVLDTVWENSRENSSRSVSDSNIDYSSSQSCCISIDDVSSESDACSWAPSSSLSDWMSSVNNANAVMRRPSPSSALMNVGVQWRDLHTGKTLLAHEVLSLDERNVQMFMNASVFNRLQRKISTDQAKEQGSRSEFNLLDRLLPMIRIVWGANHQAKGDIVKSFQHAGHTVAACGQGFDDSLALAAADVGIGVLPTTELDKPRRKKKKPMKNDQDMSDEDSGADEPTEQASGDVNDPKQGETTGEAEDVISDSDEDDEGDQNELEQAEEAAREAAAIANSEWTYVPSFVCASPQTALPNMVNVLQHGTACLSCMRALYFFGIVLVIVQCLSTGAINVLAPQFLVNSNYLLSFRTLVLYGTVFAVGLIYAVRHSRTVFLPSVILTTRRINWIAIHVAIQLAGLILLFFVALPEFSLSREDLRNQHNVGMARLAYAYFYTSPEGGLLLVWSLWGLATLAFTTKVALLEKRMDIFRANFIPMVCFLTAVLVVLLVVIWGGPSAFTCWFGLNCDNKASYKYFDTCLLGPQLPDIQTLIGDDFLVPTPANQCRYYNTVPLSKAREPFMEFAVLPFFSENVCTGPHTCISTSTRILTTAILLGMSILTTAVSLQFPALVDQPLNRRKSYTTN